jgi:hypothetical protein
VLPGIGLWKGLLDSHAQVIDSHALQLTPVRHF